MYNGRETRRLQVRDITALLHRLTPNLDLEKLAPCRRTLLGGTSPRRFTITIVDKRKGKRLFTRVFSHDFDRSATTTTTTLSPEQQL